MNYEQRQELTITATRETYKEIDAAIEAIFRQGQYIERHNDLLKVINSHCIGHDDNTILDLHLGMIRNQTQQMKTALKGLIDLFEEQIIRAEEAARNQQPQAMCRG